MNEIEQIRAKMAGRMAISVMSAEERERVIAEGQAILEKRRPPAVPPVVAQDKKTGGDRRRRRRRKLPPKVFAYAAAYPGLPREEAKRLYHAAHARKWRQTPEGKASCRMSQRKYSRSDRGNAAIKSKRTAFLGRHYPGMSQSVAEKAYREDLRRRRADV